MTQSAPIEYLYALWDANWDEGPLGNYKVLCYEITRKTARRIYFVMRGHPAFVDRQCLEADGRIFHRPTATVLHLLPPEIPHRPKPLSLPELRQAMAAAHPDRGGTDAEFIAARERYERARTAAR